MPNSLKCRLKGFVRKGLLSEKDLSRIYTDNDVIKKLEKIKEEIKELAFLLDDLSPDKELVVDLYNIETVIDNHISELKGE